MAIRDGLWPLLGRATKLHVELYRRSGGHFGHRFPGAPPMLLLEHVGAKTGEARVTPLAYTKDGQDLVLVASKGGHPRNPSWLHNLVANPDVSVQIGSQRRAVRARIASGIERERLWPMVLAVHAGYADYQRRTAREIPLIVLEPRAKA